MSLSAALPIAYPVFLGLPPHLHSTGTDVFQAACNIFNTFTNAKKQMLSPCISKGTKNHRVLESKEKKKSTEITGENIAIHSGSK